MTLVRRVLVVSPTSFLAKTLASVISRAGHRVTAVETFQAAKAHLQSAPDLLITDLKLGEYNGLHLALRCRAVGIPVIVVADKSFEPDVEQLGATWMSPEVIASDTLPLAIARVLDNHASAPTFAWYEPDQPPRAFGVPDLPSSPLLH